MSERITFREVVFAMNAVAPSHRLVEEFVAATSESELDFEIQEQSRLYFTELLENYQTDQELYGNNILIILRALNHQKSLVSALSCGI